MERYLASISDAVWFTPALFVLLAFTALLWEVARQRSRVAAPGTVGARFAGNSSRLNLESLNITLITRLLFTVGFAVLAGLASNAAANGDNFPLVHAVMFTGACVALILTLWTWSAVIRWGRFNVRFQTEQGVGRKLNLLMLDGCRVFHDLADPAVGNIDHIIVAPHAVFSVETLAPESGIRESAEGGKTVVFNGRELRFPGHTTSKPVKQAARSAGWLRKYLATMTGVEVPVHALLAVPGWTVQRTEKGRVTVLNPEEIPSVVVDKAAQPLYEAQRLHVISLLDARCH